MADVRLDFYDLDDDALPDMCMKCAAPSTVRPVRTFSWTPYWARFMPPLIAVWFIKRRRVSVPLCEQHKGHWTIPMIIGLGGLAVLLVLGVFGGVMLASDDGANGPASVFGGLCLAAAGILFIAWLITLIVFSAGQITVFEIADDSIVLKNVSPEFVRAYREMTRGGVGPDVERAAREQFGRPGARPPQYDDPRRRGRDDDYPPDDKYRRG